MEKNIIPENDYLRIIGFSQRRILYNNNHDDNKINLVLDLDQTLIDSEIHKFNNNYRHKYKLESELLRCNCDDNNFIIHGRNNLFDFLFFMKDKFNIYIYTNAKENYTEMFIKCVDDFFGGKFFSGFVCRDDDNIYNLTKQLDDLNLRNITIYNTIIIDDRTDIWNEKYHSNIIQIIVFRHEHYDFDDELNIIKKIFTLCQKDMNVTNMNKIVPIINEIYKNYDENKYFLFFCNQN